MCRSIIKAPSPCPGAPCSVSRFDPLISSSVVTEIPVCGLTVQSKCRVFELICDSVAGEGEEEGGQGMT